MSLLLASEPVFQLLRGAGALYLIYLGLQSLRSAWRSKPLAMGAYDAHSQPSLDRRTAFAQGLINDLANPKMAAFFASVLPQFVVPGPDAFLHFVLLGVVFSLLAFGWLTPYVVLIQSARTFMNRITVRRTLDGIAGVTLIGFGVRVAMSER